MSKREYNDYRPEIIGMDWEPGNLILVASHSYGGKSQYVLGNCIVAGTKEKKPSLTFCRMAMLCVFGRKSCVCKWDRKHSLSFSGVIS